MDADEPRKRTGYALGANLDRLSVEELEELRVALADEIDRLESEIARKRTDRSAADSLFRR